MEILGYWKSCFDVEQSDDSSDEERRSNVPQRTRRRTAHAEFSRTSESRKALRYISSKSSSKSLTRSHTATSNTSITKRVSRALNTSTSSVRSRNISRTPTTNENRNKKLSLSEIKETWYDYSDTSDWSDDSMISVSSSSSSSSSSSFRSMSSSPPTSVTSGYCEGSDSSYKYDFDRMTHSDDSSDSDTPYTEKRRSRDTRDYYYYPVRVTVHSQDSIDNALDDSSENRSSIYSNGNQYTYVSTQTGVENPKPTKQSTGFGYNRWYKQSNTGNKNIQIRNTEGQRQSSVKQSNTDNISFKGRQPKVYQPSRGFGYNRWYQPKLSDETN